MPDTTQMRERPEAEKIVGDLAMLVKRLARRLPEGHELRKQAVDYLVRYNLQGSQLRAALSETEGTKT